MKRLATFLSMSLAAAVTTGGSALAAKPEDWQIGMQPAASPVMAELQDFHNLLLVIITGITIFVLALLVYVFYRFSEKRNPEPSKTSHNTVLEALWTVVPVIILVVIAIPSFKLLYFMDRIPDSDMTVKAIGRQWYWSYEYPDHGGFQFDSFMIPADQLEEGDLRQLSADTALVIPEDTTVRILVTASDVLHSFAMPAFGIKTDAVPGRLNETWVRVDEPGTYYGQCSEICGTGHADMPIEVRVLPKDEFEKWVEGAKEEYASTMPKSPVADDRQIAEADSQD